MDKPCIGQEGESCRKNNQCTYPDCKMTAVEWLDDELWKLRLKLRGGEISFDFYCEQEVKLIEKAKEIEEEQRKTDSNKAKKEFMLELDKQILDFEHDFNRTSSQHKYFDGAMTHKLIL